MIPILLGAVFLAGCTLGAFLVLVIGIHIEERRFVAGATTDGGRVEIAARQVMGVYVRKPGQPTGQVRK